MTTPTDIDALPHDRADAILDAVLRASGSGLRHHTMESSRERMRVALRSALDEHLKLPALLAEVEGLRAVVNDLRDLIAQSRGVAGLHMNGDIAEWDWLLGNEWLQSLSNLDSTTPPGGE